MEIQWPLVVFTLFTGVAGWLFFFTGLNEFTKKSEKDGFIPGIVSIVLLALGALASILHLSHPDRILGALGHPTSGIFTEFVLVMLLGVFILVYLVCLKRDVHSGIKVFAVLGMVFGVLISFMAGYSYLMPGRLAWDTILLPLGYLGTAIPVGAGLYWALSCKDEKSGSFAALSSAVGGAVALVTVGAYGAFTGGFAGVGLPLLSLTLLCSAVLPLVCGILGKNKPTTALAWIAVIAAVLGALFYRIMMWVVGSGFYNFFGNN